MQARFDGVCPAALRGYANPHGSIDFARATETSPRLQPGLTRAKRLKLIPGLKKEFTANHRDLFTPLNLDGLLKESVHDGASFPEVWGRRERCYC